MELDPGGGSGLDEASTSSVNQPSKPGNTTSQQTPLPSADEIRTKRSSFLDRFDKSEKGTTSDDHTNTDKKSLSEEQSSISVQQQDETVGKVPSRCIMCQ